MAHGDIFLFYKFDEKMFMLISLTFRARDALNAIYICNICKSQAIKCNPKIMQIGRAHV